MVKQKPYYLSQDNWSSDDFYSLHRYLHRMILHYDKKKDEITQLDIGRMSERTRVLLYCIIRYYHLDTLFELANLHELINCRPLSEPLVLGDHGLKEENVYYSMNVLF